MMFMAFSLEPEQDNMLNFVFSLDVVTLPSKQEPAKEQAVQPAVVRKPTVIRIPAKPTKGNIQG